MNMQRIVHKVFSFNIRKPQRRNWRIFFYWSSLETTSDDDGSGAGWETICFVRKTTKANLKLYFSWCTLHCLCAWTCLNSLVISWPWFQGNTPLLRIIHDLITSLSSQNVDDNHGIELRTFHDKPSILRIQLAGRVLSPILFFQSTTVSFIQPCPVGKIEIWFGNFGRKKMTNRKWRWCRIYS